MTVALLVVTGTIPLNFMFLPGSQDLDLPSLSYIVFFNQNEHDVNKKKSGCTGSGSKVTAKTPASSSQRGLLKLESKL